MDPYLVALINLPKMTPTRLRKILANFSTEQAWQVNFFEFIQVGLEPKWVEEIMVAKNKIEPKREVEKLNKLRARLIHENDEDFPLQLKNIPTNPAWIFVRGSLLPIENQSITVVGPRKISNYGKQVTEEFVSFLAKQGINIISGLALGVDSLAHESTLQIGGRTVAVLGTGLDQVYPSQNRNLFQKILDQGGSIISEYPIGVGPSRQNFPIRNRIVAGLSRATLIVEASERSGSLITAEIALEQGKDVFAVPGNIYSENSNGTNRLIKSGQAQAVTSPMEIIAELQMENLSDFREAQRVLPANQTERKIFEFLSREPKQIDEIVRESKLSSAEISVALSMLEMKGFVLDLGGQNYVKK